MDLLMAHIGSDGMDLFPATMIIGFIWPEFLLLGHMESIIYGSLSESIEDLVAGRVASFSAK
ncbi:hypothetical protein CDAR_410381, partial [Caerostris darwini]